MTKFCLRLFLATLALTGGAALLGISVTNANAASNASAFAAENEAAMKTMMAEMHVPPSGMVDRDFLVMMVPHHQGAIDMCEAVLRHGTNAEVKNLCGQIVAKQAEEIAAMQRLLATMPGSPAETSSATHDGSHSHHGH